MALPCGWRLLQAQRDLARERFKRCRLAGRVCEAVQPRAVLAAGIPVEVLEQGSGEGTLPDPDFVDQLGAVAQGLQINIRRAVLLYFPAGAASGAAAGAGSKSTSTVVGAYLYAAPVAESVVEPKSPPKMMLPQNQGSRLLASVMVLDW